MPERLAHREGGAKPGRTFGSRAAWFLAVLLALCSTGPGTASTLQNNPAAPGYVHEVFGVDDGLPSAGLIQVLQTQDGYLWISSWDGLVRYDGARFEILRSDEYPALRSNRVGSLREDRHGTLWIMVDQSCLVRYREGRFSACGPIPGGISCALPASDAKDFAIHEDPGGALWIVWGGQIFRVNSDDPMPRKVFDLPFDDTATEIVSDAQGRLWIVTEDRLWLGQWNTREHVAFVEVDRGVKDLGVDDQGTLWISRDAEVGRIEDGIYVPVHEDLGASFLEDPAGGLWASTTNRRLYRVLGGAWKLIAEDPEHSGQESLPYHALLSIPGDSSWIAWRRFLLRDSATVLTLGQDVFQMYSVTRDRSGTVWASGTAAGELHAFHPVRLETLTEGMPKTATLQVFEDHDGTLWTGDGYLLAMAPGASRFEVRARTDQILETMLRDRNGVLWAAFGLEPVHPEASAWIRIAAPTARALALHQDRKGDLWAAGWHGLFRHDASDAWPRVQPTAGEPIPTPIRVIQETSDGALWLGTGGQGVGRWLDGHSTVITHHHGLASDYVRAIWPAPEGHLWIATDDRGLSRLDPTSVGAPGGPRIVNVDRRHGLYTNGIHQIVDDGLGHLWMSSNDGIFRVRRDELEAVADALAAGEPAELVSVSYDERDGMRTREANGGMQGSGLRDQQGRIVFPTMDGVVRLDPRELTRAREPPPIHIQSLRHESSRTVVRNGAELPLQPAQRSFAVTYTAPTFRAADRLRFRYRLRPFDDAWIDAGPRREAPYTKVPPGSYTFEVAVNFEGAWGEPASITLEVVPRFHETAWFRLLSGLVGLALVFGWARRREHLERTRRRALENEVRDRTATIRRQTEKLRQLDEIKSQFFANVSHEFRTPLTLVLGPLRDALSGSLGALDEPLAGQLAVAEDNAERVLGLVDQLLDVARLDAGGLRLRWQILDLGAFLALRVEALQPLAERVGVGLRLQRPDSPVEIAADPTQLAKILDNLLGNALKFSPEGETVDVTLEDADTEQVAMIVRDRGPGIPEGERERIFERFYRLEPDERSPGAGLGLALARQLAALHGGALSVTSPDDGPGACFTLSLRRGSAHVDGEPSTTESTTTDPGALPPPGDATLVRSTPEPEAPAEAMSRRSATRPRVLIVDDHPEIRAYLRRHLGEVFDVTEAADGKEALQLAREQPPELVISDIMMPGLDGTALFRALRDDPKLASIPVILVTAKASAESRLEGLREGVDDYLVKPFDPHELVARVENMIAARRKSSQPPRGLQVSEIDATPAGQSLVARVKAIIEERVGDPDLNVEALADAVGCERSHLLRQLRTLTGETPSGLIRSMRLQRAAQLLRAEAGTVSEIAARVGFKSAPHFSTTFFKHFGERPTTYAERHRRAG